jgi:hypothetical protein
MLLMPYDTTQGRMYQVDPIVSKIKSAQIDLPLPEVVSPGGNTIKNLFFVAPNEEHEDVKAFTQFVNLGTDQEPKLVLDGRPYMRLDRRTGTYRLTAENDWMFQCVRAALTLNAMDKNKGPVEMRRLGDVPMITFIKWITRAIVGKFNLDGATELKISAVCAYYYLGMIDERIATDAEERVALVNIVRRVTGLPENRTIMEISDSIKSLKTLDDLAKTISQDLGSIRMGELNASDIITLVQSSYFGVNARENVGVALEHVPTFIAMVYNVIMDRSYKKTTLASRALTSGRPNELRAFTDLVYRKVAEQFK